MGYKAPTDIQLKPCTDKLSGRLHAKIRISDGNSYHLKTRGSNCFAFRCLIRGLMNESIGEGHWTNFRQFRLPVFIHRVPAVNMITRCNPILFSTN